MLNFRKFPKMLVHVWALLGNCYLKIDVAKQICLVPPLKRQTKSIGVQPPPPHITALGKGSNGGGGGCMKKKGVFIIISISLLSC